MLLPRLTWMSYEQKWRPNNRRFPYTKTFLVLFQLGTHSTTMAFELSAFVIALFVN